MIQIRDLTVRAQERDILRSVSADVPDASLTCLLGPNGSGKTTLLKALAGILPPGGGRITLDGRPLSDLSGREKARLISYLPQARPVPHIRVKALVEHGRFPYEGFSRRTDPEGEAAIRSAMELTGTLALAGRMLPELSGGERQRVYIAMALAQETRILLLDEPTSSLDLPYQLEILELMKTLARAGKAVVSVLHDLPQSFTYADNLLLLDGGRLTALGSPAEGLSSDAVPAVFGCRVGREPAPDALFPFYLSKARPGTPPSSAPSGTEALTE